MVDLAAHYAADGFVVFDADPRVARWADAARAAGREVAADPQMQQRWLRHGKTWFVGVDALPNGPDGSIEGVALNGPWRDVVNWDTWHPAQLSIIYEGYPQQDADESDAAHRYRVNRAAAHVDGLHLEATRRIIREPHAFIIGLPLTQSDACPLVVWRGSHSMMHAALSDGYSGGSPIGHDVTERYKAARARVFEACERVEVQMQPGQAVLLDRFLLHGVAPWKAGDVIPAEGRMVAYFRPVMTEPSLWFDG